VEGQGGWAPLQVAHCTHVPGTATGTRVAVGQNPGKGWALGHAGTVCQMGGHLSDH